LEIPRRILLHRHKIPIFLYHRSRTATLWPALAGPGLNQMPESGDKLLFGSIPIPASRCPHCTSQVTTVSQKIWRLQLPSSPGSLSSGWVEGIGSLKDSKCEYCGFRLFLEKVEEGLTMAVDYLGSSRAAPLLFHKDLRLKKGTEIVDAFVRHPHLDSFGAFVAG
jgi:hypothetical protein